MWLPHLIYDPFLLCVYKSNKTVPVIASGLLNSFSLIPAYLFYYYSTNIKSICQSKSRVKEWWFYRCLRIEGKKCSLWDYIWDIKVNTRIEDIMFVEIGKSFCWKWVAQSSGSWEEDVQVELPSYLKNTMWRIMIMFSLRGMAGISIKGQTACFVKITLIICCRVTPRNTGSGRVSPR